VANRKIHVKTRPLCIQLLVQLLYYSPHMANRSPDPRSGIYVRYNPEYGTYYAGQTRNIGYRYQDDPISGYQEQTVVFSEYSVEA
jgi:hypothetical protein